MTISDVLDFIFNHPCGYSKVFKGWKEPEVAKAIQEAIKENCFAWSQKDGKINGIVLARKIEEEKKLHIIGIIADRDDLRGMLVKYKMLYDGWRVVGNRKGKLVDFTKHLELLWNLK